MKWMFILLVLIALCNNSWATAQIPDRLIYKGTTYYLHNNPLEAYFKKYPKKRPEGDVASTALWRGYIATFEFENNILVLKDLQIQVWMHEEGEEEWAPDVTLKSVLKEIFPEGKSLGIDWCTEILILPHGQLKNYVHRGYKSTYEYYLLLEIKEGKLLKEKEFEANTFVQFKKEQLRLFKTTKDYTALSKKWKDKYEYTTQEVDAYLEESIFKHLHTFLEE